MVYKKLNKPGYFKKSLIKTTQNCYNQRAKERKNPPTMSWKEPPKEKPKKYYNQNPEFVMSKKKHCKQSKRSSKYQGTAVRIIKDLITYYKWEETLDYNIPKGKREKLTTKTNLPCKAESTEKNGPLMKQNTFKHLWWKDQSWAGTLKCKHKYLWNPVRCIHLSSCEGVV